MTADQQTRALLLLRHWVNALTIREQSELAIKTEDFLAEVRAAGAKTKLQIWSDERRAPITRGRR